MKLYRRKPVALEAVQVTTEFLKSFDGEPVSYVAKDGKTRWIYPYEDCVLVQTLEGTVRANIGDYLIRGVYGEFYPCDAEIFPEIYEPIEQEATHDEIR